MYTEGFRRWWWWCRDSNRTRVLVTTATLLRPCGEVERTTDRPHLGDLGETPGTPPPTPLPAGAADPGSSPSNFSLSSHGQGAHSLLTQRVFALDVKLDTEVKKYIRVFLFTAVSKSTVRG